MGTRKSVAQESELPERVKVKDHLNLKGHLSSKGGTWKP